jgi:hypothetical protein
MELNPVLPSMRLYPYFPPFCAPEKFYLLPYKLFCSPLALIINYHYIQKQKSFTENMIFCSQFRGTICCPKWSFHILLILGFSLTSYYESFVHIIIQIITNLVTPLLHYTIYIPFPKEFLGLKCFDQILLSIPGVTSNIPKFFHISMS